VATRRQNPRELIARNAVVLCGIRDIVRAVLIDYGSSVIIAAGKRQNLLENKLISGG
jgi:hypothetical protein